MDLYHKQHRYCKLCGASLIIEERPLKGWERLISSFFGVEKFDSSSGLKKIAKVYRCRNSRWYNGHDSGFEVDR